MYGAILGDIIGSPFEFDRGSKTKDFELFSTGCEFTDDSVMTIAIAEAFLAVGPGARKSKLKKAIVDKMQDWGRRYPDAGYGARFVGWLGEENPKPYGSYGNGSAMRVSAVGWMYPTIEKTGKAAKLTAEVTHNHPEGIKGAVATASCIFLARNGASKDEIRRYVEKEFHYDLSRSLDDIRPTYHHVESCQQTVPEAITAFLEAEDFEDSIRNAVSLGGDTDTLAAITGSIAEAFFGVPEILKAECRNRIDAEMLRVLDAFDEAFGTKNANQQKQLDENELANKLLVTAINGLYENGTHDSFRKVLASLCFQMENGGCGLVPYVSSGGNMLSGIDISGLKKGDTLTLDHEVRMSMDMVTAKDGVKWLYIFTDKEELNKNRVPAVIVEVPYLKMFQIARNNEQVAGVVINPFGKCFKMDKQIIEFLFAVYGQDALE